MALTKNCLLAGYSTAAAPTTATGSADDPSYPASKLLSDDLFDSWRSLPGSLSGVTLTLELLAPTVVSYAALMGCNLNPASATVQLQLAQLSDPTFAAALWDSTTVAPWDISQLPQLPYTPPWGRLLLMLPPAVANVTWIRWTLTDPTPGIAPPPVPGQPAFVPDNYLRADVCRAGADWWQPSPAPWNAAGVNFDDSWEQADIVGGDAAAPIAQRGHKFKFAAANESDQAFLLALQRNLRGVLRLIVVPRPLSTASWLQENLWGYSESSSGQGTAAASTSPITVTTPLPDFQGKAKGVQVAFREAAT
jgi:hypothetical protein